MGLLNTSTNQILNARLSMAQSNTLNFILHHNKANNLVEFSVVTDQVVTRQSGMDGYINDK